MKVFHSNQSLGNGSSVDPYAVTVNDTDNASRTPRHRLIVQNRSGQTLDVMGQEWLGVSPPVGYKLEDGKTLDIVLDGQLRLHVMNRSGSSVSNIHVTIFLI